MKKRMIWLIYHSVDLDGECSGALLRRFHEHSGMKINEDFKMIPMNYGDEFDDSQILAGDEVIFADFCMQPYERVEALSKRCKVLVYDHHKSAFPDLERFGIEGDYGEDNIAGCELVWRNFSEEPVPKYVKLLSDYDCWNSQDKKYWKEEVVPFQMGMRANNMKPNTEDGYKRWRDIFWMEKANALSRGQSMESWMSSVIELGNTLIRYQGEQDKTTMDRAFDLEFEGLKILAVNSYKGSPQFKTKWNPDKYDAMMIFYNMENKFWSVSLYSENKPDLDLSKIAKKWGGGGHPSACGFQVQDIRKVIGDIKE